VPSHISKCFGGSLRLLNEIGGEGAVILKAIRHARLNSGDEPGSDVRMKASP
jgi:hypothetical protein